MFLSSVIDFMSFHISQDPDRKTMRARQTGSYMSFKQDLERALAAAEGTKQSARRPGIITPKSSLSAGNYPSAILQYEYT